MALALSLLPGCAPPSVERRDEVAPVGHTVYAAHLAPGLSLAPMGRIGRGDAPWRLAPLSIRSAEPRAPLRAPFLWQLPAPGPALAAVAGSDEDGTAVELIDVDAGQVRWRVREPEGPIVGVTATAIIGAGSGTWALDLEGETLWQTGSAFAAMAGEVVAVAGSMEQVTLVAASSGRELWRATLPEGLVASDVRWACLEERELLLVDDRGGLHRVVEEEEGASRRAWTAGGERFAHVEGCGGELLATTGEDDQGFYELALVDRARGTVKARVAEVKGHWPREGGGWVVAGAGGVRRYDAQLAAGELVTAAALGPRLASRGGRALVQAEQGLALLEASGAVYPLAAVADSAALGDSAVLTSVWSRSLLYGVMRGGLPAVGPSGARLALARSSRPALPPAPLVDVGELKAVQPKSPPRHELPAPAEAGLVVAAGEGVESGVVAVLRGAAGPELVRHGLDGKLRWRAAQGCPGERAVALVADSKRVLCLGGGAGGRSALAARDLLTGEVIWRRELAAESVQLSGELVLVRGADRASVLRASDGAELSSWHSDDGERVRAALIEVEGAGLLISHEGGVVMARWPLAGMLPLWALAVDGQVADLQADGAGALVVLAGGEAYSLRGSDGRATPIAGEAERWLASADGILGWSRTSPSIRLALYGRDGALRWAHDLSLPGSLELMASPLAGGSAVLYGETRELALPLGERGFGEPIALPESAATAIWVRPLTAANEAPRWAGVSTTAARWWVF
jgi:PQQ-like domain